jgi:RNA polymerase sigma factor (TIGR02999 family)
VKAADPGKRVSPAGDEPAGRLANGLRSGKISPRAGAAVGTRFRRGTGHARGRIPPLDPTAPITELLEATRRRDPGAADELFSRLYTELRAVAGAQRPQPGVSLHPTDLVHESYLRLIASTDRTFESRKHFVRSAAQAMRHILVDHIRARRAAKRGGGALHESILDALAIDASREDELLDVHEALDALAAIDDRAARVVTMRFFLGLSESEIADVLDVTDRTVRRDWVFARAWLARHLKQQPPPNE